MCHVLPCASLWRSDVQIRQIVTVSLWSCNLKRLTSNLSPTRLYSPGPMLFYTGGMITHVAVIINNGTSTPGEQSS
jgi:hypothetical protein